MNKAEIQKVICDCGVVAVVRAENGEQAVRIADACAKAGITALEITFTVPGALDAIKKLAEVYNKGNKKRLEDGSGHSVCG